MAEERIAQEDKSRDKQAYKLTQERRCAVEVGRMKPLARVASARIKEREA